MTDVWFLMDEDLKESFIEIAKYEKRSVSSVLNEIWRKFVEKRKAEILDDLELYYMSLESEKADNRKYTEEEFRAKFLNK